MEIENRMVIDDFYLPKSPVCDCVDCGTELYEGDTAYVVEGEIYCEDCIGDLEPMSYQWTVNKMEFDFDF